MRILVQRSEKASVTVDDKITGKIEKGLVLLVGFTEGDNEEKIDYLINKVLNLRIFPDDIGVMNKSILEYGGSILSISQFTLYANTKKGNRPSYHEALNAVESEKLYNLFNQKLSTYIKVEKGIFGADMKVNISNIGPTTILLERE